MIRFFCSFQIWHIKSQRDSTDGPVIETGGPVAAQMVQLQHRWSSNRVSNHHDLHFRYATDLYKASEGRQKKPHHYTVRNAFKCAEISAYVFGVVISVLAALVWPACMIVLGEFSKSVFNAWIWVGLIWALIFTIIAVIVPLVWEMVSLIKKWRSSMAWDNVPLNKIEDDLANSVYSYTTNNSNDTVLKHDDTDLTDLQVNMFNRTPLPSIGKSIGSSIATEATIHNESDSRDYTGESTSTADDKASNGFDNDGYEVEEFDDGTLKIKF